MKIITELSGGADSALAFIEAQKKYAGAEFYSLFVDYGQRCAKEEEHASKFLHSRYQSLSTWKKVEVRGLFESALTQEKSGVDKVIDDLAGVYTPVRNIVLTGIALSWADAIGAERVITGSKGLVKVEGDPYSYKDSTVTFYKFMEAVINYATESSRKYIVEAILAESRLSKLSKLDVYLKLWGEYGLDFQDTFSCFLPLARNTMFAIECGVCKNCVEKLNAFNQYKLIQGQETR